MSGSPPVVGVTTYVEPASYGVWTQVAAAFVPAGYVRQLEASGAVAMLLPPRRDPDPAVVETFRLQGVQIPVVRAIVSA